MPSKVTDFWAGAFLAALRLTLGGLATWLGNSCVCALLLLANDSPGSSSLLPCMTIEYCACPIVQRMQPRTDASTLHACKGC